MTWFRKIGEEASSFSEAVSRVLGRQQKLIRPLMFGGLILVCLVCVGIILQSRVAAGARSLAQSVTGAQQPVASRQRNNQAATASSKPSPVQAAPTLTATTVAATVLANTATPPPVRTLASPPTRSAPVGMVRSAAIAVVGAADAKLAVKPGGAVIRPLANNEVLTANGQSPDGQWLYVQTTDNSNGWVATGDLVAFDTQGLPVINRQAMAVAPTIAPVTLTAAMTTSASTTTALAQPQPAKTAATAGQTARASLTVARLNVRAGPGTAYPVIASVQAGDSLVVQARNATNTWVKIAVPTVASGFGWVSVGYVKLSSPVATLPVSTATSSASVVTVSAVTTMAARVTAAPTSKQAAATNQPTTVQRTAATGLNGKLVIQSTWGGTFYLYDLASGVLRPLTSGFDPALSPDGRQIVFTRDGGDAGIYLINSDGGNEHKLFAGASGARSPMWSPDGLWIVFSEPSGDYKCYALGTNDTCASAKQIFYGKPPAKTPAAKAARNKVLQQDPREARPNFNLSIIDLNGANYRNLAALDSAQDPAWSSAGIVYAGPAGLQQTTALPGGQSTLVTASNNVKAAVTAGKYMAPVWQPGLAGAPGRIVFQANQNDHWELFSVNLDGSGLTALTQPVTTLVDQLPSNVAPSWSPDGQHLVYLSNSAENNSAGAWRVWVMNADGSNQHPLPVNLPITYTFVGERMVNWGR